MDKQQFGTIGSAQGAASSSTGLILGTPVATTSGTSVDFTIPAGAKQITLSLNGTSTNGTSGVIVQLGDAGGVETTNYLCSVGNASSTSLPTDGWRTEVNGIAAATRVGSLTLTLENSTANTWIGGGNFTDGTTFCFATGRKSLSAELTTVRITSTNGTDTFDAGEANVAYLS